MNGLPLWKNLQNEIGPWNDFNIVRGKDFVKLGKDVWIGYFCFIDGSGGLELGDHVSISSGVHILTHDSSDFRQHELVKDVENGNHIKRAPVKIGSNVQIGTNSVILPGVTIGDNVVVGALTLINKDVPSNCRVVGSPMKIIL
jgi:acetyltransferase-like isoleucine patch superfamily enzyme